MPPPGGAISISSGLTSNHKIMARRLLLLLFAVSFTFPLAHPAGAQESIRLDLNIPALRLDVWSGDEMIRSYPIAVGKPGYDTPTGTYTISHAEWNPWWHPPTHREWARNEKPTPPGPNNPMGRVKLFFMPLYFIHGTPAGESIGTPASHGCVRMLNDDVIELARILHEYAAPQISGEQLERLASRPGPTQRVNFRADIEVVIRYDPVVVRGAEIFAFPDIYERGALHSEAVYQALLAAGYDVSDVDYADVRRFVDNARGQRAPVVMKLDDVFSGKVVISD